MFFNSKRCLFSVSVLLISLLSGSATEGQTNPRQAAMRQAQMRAAQQDRYASAGRQTNNTRTQVARAQGSGTRTQNSNVSGEPAPIVGGPTAGGYMPQHLSGMSSGQVVSDGQVMGGGSPIVSDGYYDDGYYEGGGESYSDGGGCADGSCGIGQNYFDGDCGGCGNCGSCIQRNGGCGPECWQNCWLWGLAGIFSNAEVIGGAQGFRSNNFTVGNQLVDDSSFGFYGGLNLGLSMCKLTCGLFSGQIGVRSVQSEFDGDLFSTDNRDQLYVTGGVFRRVDYGLQAGVVYDYLRENWFVETSLAQVRGDIGWVYQGGNTLGFRFALGTGDDITNGIVNGAAFNNLTADVIDNYRFYYRIVGANGGNCDLFAGWSDRGSNNTADTNNINHAVLGLEHDMPINGFWGLQSGFTYFLPDVPSGTAASTQDAWNVYAGVSFRPQGLAWYGNYDRPLFNVADNGSFVFGRR